MATRKTHCPTEVTVEATRDGLPNIETRAREIYYNFFERQRCASCAPY